MIAFLGAIVVSFLAGVAVTLRVLWKRGILTREDVNDIKVGGTD